QRPAAAPRTPTYMRYPGVEQRPLAQRDPANRSVHSHQAAEDQGRSSGRRSHVIGCPVYTLNLRNFNEVDTVAVTGGAPHVGAGQVDIASERRYNSPPA